MKHAVRALGWATKAFWVLIIAFTGTAIYSALNLRISRGQPQVFSSSNGPLVLSLPLLINNTGYYDLSELNATVYLMDDNNSFVSASSTFVPLVPRDSVFSTATNISLDMNDFIQGAPSYLFNDTVFNVDTSLSLRYAYAFAFGFSQNTTIDWGAPLYDFSPGHISYQPHNSTHQMATIPLSFENHSTFFSVTGTVCVEMYNEMNDFTGSGALIVDVAPHSTYENHIEVFVESSTLTGSGMLCYYFDTSMFSFGPLAMSYG